MSTDANPSELNRQELQRVFALYSSGQFENALAAATAIDRRHPREPTVLTLLGVVHAAMSRHDTAVTCFCQVVELRPDVAGGHYHLGTALLETADPDTREAAAYLLCDLCDRLDDVDAAFT